MQTLYTYEMIILVSIKFNTSYQIKITFQQVKTETSKTAV